MSSAIVSFYVTAETEAEILTEGSSCVSLRALQGPAAALAASLHLHVEDPAAAHQLAEKLKDAADAREQRLGEAEAAAMEALP